MNDYHRCYVFYSEKHRPRGWFTVYEDGSEDMFYFIDSIYGVTQEAPYRKVGN